MTVQSVLDDPAAIGTWTLVPDRSSVLPPTPLPATWGTHTHAQVMDVLAHVPALPPSTEPGGCLPVDGFGRGERLPPLPRATTATVLPASGVTGADVEAVKFAQVLRGYKTSEVDWVLERLGAELDGLRAELAAVRALHGVPDGRPGPGHDL